MLESMHRLRNVIDARLGSKFRIVEQGKTNPVIDTISFPSSIMSINKTNNDEYQGSSNRRKLNKSYQSTNNLNTRERVITNDAERPSESYYLSSRQRNERNIENRGNSYDTVIKKSSSNLMLNKLKQNHQNFSSLSVRDQSRYLTTDPLGANYDSKPFNPDIKRRDILPSLDVTGKITYNSPREVNESINEYNDTHLLPLKTGSNQAITRPSIKNFTIFPMETYKPVEKELNKPFKRQEQKLILGLPDEEKMEEENKLISKQREDTSKINKIRLQK